MNGKIQLMQLGIKTSTLSKKEEGPISHHIHNPLSPKQLTKTTKDINT
jgi:hypothetical protein